MHSSDERTLILNTEPVTNQLLSAERTEQLKNVSIITLSLLVALPTSFLNGLAAIVGPSGNLDNLDSLNALKELLANQSVESIIFGAVCFLASLGVLAGLNKKYLVGAACTVFNLIKKDLNFIKSLIMEDEISDRPSLIENGLFLWCFFTSLIFAELGKQTLAFLKTPGEQTGFYLNLVVYFSTRFSGARALFQTYIDARQHDAEISESEDTSLIRKIIPISGYLLAFFFAVPLVINFIPESVKGLQSLCHSNLTADSQYQNPVSISLGIFGSLPTAFFYALAIKAIPKHFSDTVSLVYTGAKNRDLATVLGIINWTILAGAASYFTSMGFRLVGSTNVANGYLSYLSDPVQDLMPVMLFISCVLMFFSHLQHLVNDRYTEIVNTSKPDIPSLSLTGFFANKHSNDTTINTKEHSEIVYTEPNK